MKPIVLIHGYSTEGKASSPEEIYGTLPAQLRKIFGSSKVVDINLSRWISLNDGIAIDDISFAMDRALQSARYKKLLSTGFHVVIHSTGALVVRNWIRRFSPKPSPVENLVYLAGANFGSGLAHIGRGQLSRWGRLLFMGTGRGIQVLDELEFGSSKSLDLHLHFLKPQNDMYDDYQVQEFCAIGSQTLQALRAVPIRYVKEDSSDNTVRTSAGNLNFNYITVSPKSAAYKIALKDLKAQIDSREEGKDLPAQYYVFNLDGLAEKRRTVPFALLYETSHFGEKIGIVSGIKNRRRVMPLIEEALSTSYDATAYEKIAKNWAAVSATTLNRASRLTRKPMEWDRQAQYEGHAQLIFRVRDQYGDDVKDYDITFNTKARKKDENRLELMIEDKHVNKVHPGTITFYLRLQKIKKKVIVDQLKKITARLHLEITAFEKESKDIDYLPLKIDLSPDQQRQILQPFRTTLIDVTLLRLPSEKVFAMTPAK